MKPIKKVAIGQIVHILFAQSEFRPAIVTAVHAENCINVTSFSASGEPIPLTSVYEEHSEGAENFGMHWRHIENESEREALLSASVAPMETAYGGINFLRLLSGDFGAIVGPLMVMLYQSNRSRISEGADRIMTPPAASIDYILDRLGIHNPDKRQKVREAAQRWGDAGGDFLTALADGVGP